MLRFDEPQPRILARSRNSGSSAFSARGGRFNGGLLSTVMSILRLNGWTNTAFPTPPSDEDSTPSGPPQLLVAIRLANASRAQRSAMAAASRRRATP